MKLIFMGTPEFSVPILEMLYQKHEVLAVVTQPDKKVGRKQAITFSPVKEKALALNLLVYQPESLRKDYQFILDLKPDYIITAAYGQMLPQELLNEIESINVHGSLLPKYRGGAPIQYALFDGLNQTGITIMYMAYQMDSGDIIIQEPIDIEKDDNTKSLTAKLSQLGVRLLDQVLTDLSKGIKNRIPQDPSQVTFAKTLKVEDEWISFTWNTDKIINRIRGLSPDIGASIAIHQTILKCFKAIRSDIICDNSIEPGTVLEVKKKLIVKTNDGALEMLEIQAPGKKKMNVKDFLNGQNIIHVGDVFIEGMKKHG
ncbi:MAG: methionyl-tRNA formyltransferase [Acholeplasmataceae bacterium]|jgi:methionyl-tRNA formyltransferase|nr:methionyl-tRNA formyltransferase [Acholeplasmataceae bacterium]